MGGVCLICMTWLNFVGLGHGARHIGHAPWDLRRAHGPHVMPHGPHVMARPRRFGGQGPGPMGYDVWPMSTSYVPWGMSCALSHVSCVPWAMSHVLCPMSCILCPVLRPVSRIVAGSAGSRLGVSAVQLVQFSKGLGSVRDVRRACRCTVSVRWFVS